MMTEGRRLLEAASREVAAEMDRVARDGFRWADGPAGAGTRRHPRGPPKDEGTRGQQRDAAPRL